MDFDLPADLVAYLARLDAFIESDIKPLQSANDNERFFDHRSEWARTDWDRGGLPRTEWEALLNEARQRADRAGFYRFSLPREYGGSGGSNLWMAVIREHLAAKGLGLHNDLQNEHSCSGKREVRTRASALRQDPSGKPGDPVAARQARYADRDVTTADSQDRLGDGSDAAPRSRKAVVGQGVDVQLLGEPAGLRRRGSSDAGARRHRLLATQAVRAHLPASSAIQDHGRVGRDSDAQGGCVLVRIYPAELGRVREAA
jgi:alkylation response protein AidB-like acyl-CoA dehydrogenase